MKEEGGSSEGGGGGGIDWYKLVRRRLPVLCWGAQYTRLAAISDLVAGVTLGLTLVPQAMAYAALAGLPVHYGLYSSFMGTMLYVLVGTVKEVSIGPTSLMALLTLQATRDLPLEYVPLLAFLSGWVVILMAVLRLGFLVEFISPAVSSGFTSGTALLIVGAQVKGLVGVSFPSESLYENLSGLAERWHEVRLADTLLGVVCCIALLLLRKLKDVPVRKDRRVLRKCLWLVSIGRNAIVVCVASVFAYCTHGPTEPLVRLSGRVASGVPSFAWPSFSVTSAGEVGVESVGFLGMVQQLGSALVMVPVVMVLANIAIASSFSSGRPFDATQEMLALGLCNVAGAMVGAMPTCGAFTRSAVSHSSGVRTPAAGLYSGIITLIALSFMTKYFYFIPKACLSAVLICAVIFMVDVSTVVSLWRRSRVEVVVVACTAGTALAASVELAVPAGALVSALALLARLAAQPVHVSRIQVHGTPVIVIRVPSALVYFQCSRLTRAVLSASGDGVGVGVGVGVTSQSPPRLLLDCTQLAVVDHAALQTVSRLCVTHALVPYRAAPHVAAALRLHVPQQHASTVLAALTKLTESEALAAMECSKEAPSETDPLLNGGGPVKCADNNAVDTVIVS